MATDCVSEGWFTEENPTWPGQRFGLEIEEVIHREKSEFQDILIFKSKQFGNVLALDGIIQCTERDEFSYQECIAHIPLFSHPNPQKVLVVGGGDGGVLREITKHPSVQEVHICEIDKRVIDLSKQYLPQLGVGFSSPKVNVHVLDGNKFLESHPNEFDVIITDSSDPVGPAVCLFEKPYYEKINQSLRPGGIMCCQGESMWMDLPLIAGILDMCRGIYPVVTYASAGVPTYPLGQIGFILASKNTETVFEAPLRSVTESQAEDMKLKYYDSKVHTGAFILPRFVKKALSLK